MLASDYTIEHEFRAMIAMEGVDLFMARIANDPRVTPETLAAMEPLLTDTASRILPGDRLDVLAYGCTSASVVLGRTALPTGWPRPSPTPRHRTRSAPPSPPLTRLARGGSGC